MHDGFIEPQQQVPQLSPLRRIRPARMPCGVATAAADLTNRAHRRRRIFVNI
jgi:hypothetical protein